MNIGRNIEIEFLQDKGFEEFSLSTTPYISSVDAEEEYVVIRNPSSKDYDLHNHFLDDGHQKHRFQFPAKCFVPAYGDLFFYTCPGGNHTKGKLKQPHVLWTNHDGSLRRKEVLNNEHCEVKLYNPESKCLAKCRAAGKDGSAVATRRSAELRSLARWQFRPRVQLTLNMIRMLVLLSMLFCVQDHPKLYISLYWVSFILDLIARSGDDAPVPATVLTTALLADRISSLVLGGSLLLLSYTSSPELKYLIDNLSKGSRSSSDWSVGIMSRATWMRMSPATLALALLLDFTAHTLFPPLQRVTRSWRSSQEGHILLPAREHRYQDVYRVIRDVHPVLLTAACIAGEYYMLHCYNNYHYFNNNDSNGSSNYIHVILWTVAGILGWFGFCTKQANNVSMIIAAVSRM